MSADSQRAYEQGKIIIWILIILINWWEVIGVSALKDDFSSHLKKKTSFG